MLTRDNFRLKFPKSYLLFLSRIYLDSDKKKSKSSLRKSCIIKKKTSGSFHQLFPSHLISGAVPVNEFIGSQIIFGDTRIIPSRQKILIEWRIETPGILVMLENVFG
jgi:hypothetical protein